MEDNRKTRRTAILIFSAVFLLFMVIFILKVTKVVSTFVSACIILPCIIALIIAWIYFKRNNKEF